MQHIVIRASLLPFILDIRAFYLPTSIQQCETRANAENFVEVTADVFFFRKN